MNSPRDTTKTDPLLLLADAMGPGGPSASIERWEAQGQQELVNSETIPTWIQGGSDDDLTALGFQLGEVVEDDPLFRRAVLPEGWARVPSDHSMWSHIVDPLGRRRVAMFYKAAPYDRKAHISLNTVYSYVQNCLYEGTTPVLDDTWATREDVLKVLAEIETYELAHVKEWSGHREDYAREYEAEAREKAAQCAQLADELGAPTGGCSCSEFGPCPADGGAAHE
ncbi:hypothetical protein [Sphaerimonospora thailandensis]|uniref:Uncharacterized protein n=1 Tax=Sphaerimonospora thailandensis TaxID=795644 RepID=A0A8J3R8F7_9ACTN|nr:hypothetical protein [Sphaerimonospora thailandensis]GIH70285.1 hypothetical protein Mth01_25380 [Sphaerimonospora thailandensis]